MFKTIAESVAFVNALKPKIRGANHCDIVVAPPYTALRAVADASGLDLAVAGQDVAWEKEGAFTGDVSAPMLRDAGCSHVIIGHSERRQLHGETDERVNLKIKAALAAGLLPIVCVGESLAERESNQTKEVLEKQFSKGLGGLTPQDFSRIIIAYEPVWAIGTGRTATPEIAAESHHFLRGLVVTKISGESAESVRILYGGSVKPDNIRGLMAQEDIDGALVGGASLSAESFAAIVGYNS